jgi:hypothetical protein
MKNKFLIITCCFVILLFCYFIILPTAFAQYGLEETVKETPIAKTSPAEFIGTIIKYVIGLLGVFLVALIIYGGVTYATAAGSEERAKTGKNILTYAIIGVVICALAFVLTDYTLRILHGTANSQIPYEPWGYDYSGAYSGTGCGRQGAGCWYDLNCCTGYKCDTNEGTADPTDGIPTGWCVKMKAGETRPLWEKLKFWEWW